jgi:hypothetical protein
MIKKIAAALALAVLVPAAAWAGAFQTFGPHLGFSTDPSQVIFGGQLQMGDIAPQIDFVPGVDLGIGDNQTIISLNGDFHYRFIVQGMTWQPYAGGGVAVHFWSADVGGPIGDRSDTYAEGTIVGGADVPTRSGSRFFVEGKIGLGDGPSFKATAGWHFKMR